MLQDTTAVGMAGIIVDIKMKGAYAVTVGFILKKVIRYRDIDPVFQLYYFKIKVGRLRQLQVFFMEAVRNTECLLEIPDGADMIKMPVGGQYRDRCGACSFQAGFDLLRIQPRINDNTGIIT